MYTIIVLIWSVDDSGCGVVRFFVCLPALHRDIISLTKVPN